MLLCIMLPNETTPFILEQKSEVECIQTIGRAEKLGYEFDKTNFIIESDRIVLHARKTGNKGQKKRCYVLNDKVILITSSDCLDEVQPTKDLLASEKNVDVSKITVMEV